MFSVNLISKFASPPAFSCMATSAWYIDWLKARSVVELGMRRATRNSFAAGGAADSDAVRCRG